MKKLLWVLLLGWSMPVHAHDAVQACTDLVLDYAYYRDRPDPVAFANVFPQDQLHATGVSYVTVYSAPHGATEVEGFAGIGEYHDEFVLTAAGWKIASRVFKPVFTYKDVE